MWYIAFRVTSALGRGRRAFQREGVELGVTNRYLCLNCLLSISLILRFFSGLLVKSGCICSTPVWSTGSPFLWQKNECLGWSCHCNNWHMLQHQHIAGYRSIAAVQRVGEMLILEYLWHGTRLERAAAEEGLEAHNLQLVARPNSVSESRWSQAVTAPHTAAETSPWKGAFFHSAGQVWRSWCTLLHAFTAEEIRSLHADKQARVEQILHEVKKSRQASLIQVPHNLH